MEAFPLWRIMVRFFLLLFLCVQAQNSLAQAPATPPLPKVRIDTLSFYDTVRSRLIPVATYLPTPSDTAAPVVVISHGYGENEGISYLHYTALATALAKSGYAVVSIQHELPADELLPMSGELRVTRMPNWQRGVKNILFTLGCLEEQFPQWDHGRTTLIGHSNGGDMSMLFAEMYPERVVQVISLDNRRQPLPRSTSPRVASLRSSDQLADFGVLPSVAEVELYGIRVIYLPQTRHVEMSDNGSVEQQVEINNFVLELLRNQ